MSDDAATTSLEPIPRRVLHQRFVIAVARTLTRMLGPRWFLVCPARLRSVVIVLAKAGDIVLLGGVNQRQTVEAWLRCIGPTGQLFVVEGNPRIVEELSKSLPNYPNLHLISRALWDSDEEVTFTVSDTDYQGWNCVKNPSIRSFPLEDDPTAHDIQVRGETVDNIFEKAGIKSAAVIYLTINDAQIKAVDGMRKIIANSPDLRIVIHSDMSPTTTATNAKLRAMNLRTSVKTLTRNVKNSNVDRLVTTFACH